MHSCRPGLQLVFGMLLLLGYIQGLSCPAGEHPYSCFSCLSFVTDITLDYTSARQLCQSRQGDLVNVEAAWEAEVIRRYLRSLNESREVWIGRYRNNTGCYAAQRSETIIWDSIPCTLQRPFVCVKTYGSAPQLAARAGGQVLVVNGQTLKLNVNISDISALQLEWMHGNTAVAAGSVTATDDTALLTIRSVNNLTDLGWYTLVIHDPATAYVLAAWQVRQARIEAFSVQPKSVNISAGDTAALVCVPDPATTLPAAAIQWYKNNVRVASLGRTYISNFTGALMIRNVTSADGGVYYCTASNMAGTIISQNATLVVSNQGSSSLAVQTTFVLQPRDTIALAGEPFTLECVPPFVKLSSTFISTNDNKLMPTFLSDSVFPMYSVKSASLADSNNYTCYQFILGSALILMSSSATVQVQTVAQVDNIVVILNETAAIEAKVVPVPRGTSIRLVCPYASIPPPTLVAWLFEGKEVTTGVNTSSSQTTLEVTYFDTSGMYQCLVSNVHGHSIAGVSICIQDISSLPINVSFSVQPDSQTQLLVHWAPPTSTTPTIDPLLILYEVVYVTPTSPPVSSGTLESYSRDYTITGLQAGTAYRVSVLVHLVGTSSGHSWVTASTYGNVPIRAVNDLSVTFVGETSAQVSWDPLVATPPEQPVSSYFLSYLDSQGSNVSVPLPNTITRYVITNLTANKYLQVCITYTVQVQRSHFEVSPAAACINVTDNSVGDVGSAVPRPSEGVSVNSVLLAVIITVAMVILIGVLVTVVLVGLVCQRNNSGKYSPARAEKGKPEKFNPDRQRPMGQQVFDLAPTLSMLDEAFNSLSVAMDIGVTSPKPTELIIQQQNSIAVTPPKDEEML